MNRRKLLVLIGLPLSLAGVALIGWAGAARGFGSFMAAVSDFIAVPVAFVFAVSFFYLVNRVELPDEDFIEVVYENDVRAFAIILAATLLFIAIIAHGAMAQAPDSIQFPKDRFAAERAHIAVEGVCHIGVTETPPGSNEGEYVEKCLQSVGLGPGYPYCAACASMWAEGYDMLPVGDERPFVGKKINTALSVHFTAARGWIPAKKVRRGQVDVPVGCIGVYRKGHSRHGHTVVVTGDEKNVGPWQGVCGTTVEANTTPGGSAERDAKNTGGVWGRVRCIQPSAYFRLVGFACPVEG